MTYKQALIGQPYAQRVNDVLEELYVECPFCKGIVYYDKTKKNRKECDCPECNNSRKIHYSYQPQVGEWCINKEDGYPQLISDISEQSGDLYLSSKSGHVWLSSVNFIPIHDWQIIEGILEKAGILLRLRQTPDGWVPPTKFYCDVTILHRDAARVKEFISLSIADSRIKAVYDAVIALGKEMK